MGLFGKQKGKPSPQDEAAAIEQRFMDENFREELRNHGRWYFEKIINENGALFKEDLDATITDLNGKLKEHVTEQVDTAIAQINQQLKEHVNQQLDEKFLEHSKAMETAQAEALELMRQSAQKLQEQHQQLAATLQQSIADQETALNGMFEESKAHVGKLKDSEALALQWLAQSVKALQEQHQQLEATLQQSLATQQAMLISTFESNMARIIEHYLLGALGDQYDLKAQLPSIIKQMETNKQAIVDDMKL